jgi:heat shock protein HslJ
MMNQRYTGILLALTLIAWTGCGPGSDAVSESAAATEHALDLTGAPSLEQVANMSFAGIYDTPVQLTAGTYEGAPFEEGGASRPTVRLADRLHRFGDLNADGEAEAVVLLAESSGGSGSMLYVAVAGLRDGAPANLGTARVGDRPQVLALEIEEGRIRLDVIEQGPQDAACCPTQLSTRRWSLQGDALIEQPAEVTGTLSVAILAGKEWRLVRLAQDEPAPDQPEVTLTFEDGKFAGTSGCNRYFTDVREKAPGSIELGPVGSTMMMCPDDAMELEQAFLQRFQAVGQYGILLGDLSLTWRTEDRIDALLFTPK